MANKAGQSTRVGNNYINPNSYVCPVVARDREPTTSDYRQPETGKNYPLSCLWVIQKNPTSGSEGDVWMLTKIVANQATWVQIGAGAVGPLIDVAVPLGSSPVSPNGTGTLTFTSTGGTLAITGSPNTINFDVIDSAISSLSPYIVGPTKSDFTSIESAVAQATSDMPFGGHENIYLKPDSYTELVTSFSINKNLTFAGFGEACTTAGTGESVLPFNSQGASLINCEFQLTGGYWVFNNLYISSRFIAVASKPIIIFNNCTFGGSSFENTTGIGLELRFIDCYYVGNDFITDANLSASTSTLSVDIVNSKFVINNPVTCSKGSTTFRALNSRITADVDLSGSTVAQYFMDHSIFEGNFASDSATTIEGRFTFFNGQFDVQSASTYLFNDCSFSNASDFINQQPQTIACGNVAGYARTTAPAGDYLITHLDNVILADTSAARAITLPADPFINQMHSVKDVDSGCGTNNITVGGNGNNIDGSASYVMRSDGMSATFIFNGTEWNVFSTYAGIDTAALVLTSNGPGQSASYQAVAGAGTTQIGVDANTGPGTDPVVADGSNVITVTGGQVSSSTVGANVIQTNSLAANTFTIQIQQTDTAASKDTTLNGVAHFDSALFTDDEGFISSDGTQIGQTITGDSGGALSPTGGNWNIIGGTNITTSGSGSTLTLNASGTILPQYEDPVVAASTANLSATYNNGASGVGATLTNNSTQVALTLDGVTLNTSDRVLIWQQSDQTENGIYTVTTVGDGSTNWVLTRATDYDQAAEINPGDLVPVLQGTTYAGAIFVQTLTITTIGTDGINFAIFQTTSGFTPWKFETTTAQTLQPWDKYYANNAAQVVFTLPTSAAVGTELEVAGLGAGGWRIAQNAGQQILGRNISTTVGASGYLESTNSSDTVRLSCTQANTTWKIVRRAGFLDLV